MKRAFWATFVFLVACSEDAPATPTAFPVTAFPTTGFPMTAAPVTTAPPTASGSGQGECVVYARRCEAGCKAAFLQAAPRYMMAPGFLRPEQSGVVGQCLLACDLDGDANQGCVGASSQAECDCQTACYRSSNPTPEQETQIRQLAAGLDATISSVCR